MRGRAFERRSRRAGAAAAVVVAVAVAGAVALVAHGDRRPAAPARPPAGSAARSPADKGFAAHVLARPPSLPAGRLFAVPGKVVSAVALDARHLVVEVGPNEEEGGDTLLLQRRLGGGRPVTLARGVAVSGGLASTAGWVVYVDGAGGGRRLIAVRHDGSGRVVLSRALVAPLATRGDVVAWAEQRGDRQRVVARDTVTGAEWVAADVPRCEHGRCYRIDRVTLAERGVVFTRVTSGPDASRVVRRAFADRDSSEVTIPDDPQADLAPSSAGALYYAFDRGWYRWDFGQAHPRRVALPVRPPALLLGYEAGRWFSLSQRGCRYGVTVLDRAGRPLTAVTARTLGRIAADRSACVQLSGSVWTGRRLVTSWGVAPQEELEEHLDVGLVGVVHASERLPRSAPVR